MLRIAVTGSRDIKDWIWIRDQMDWLIDNKLKDKKLSEVIFILGDASGVDKEVETYCVNYGLAFIKLRTLNHIYPAFTDKTVRPDLIKLMYLGRDIQVIEACDWVFGLWDGHSTGTKFTLDEGKKQGKLVIIQQYIKKVDL